MAQLGLCITLNRIQKSALSRQLPRQGNENVFINKKALYRLFV